MKGRESITKIDVALVSGLELDITPLSQHKEELFNLKTVFSSKLVSKYQEGLLDITLTFSDDTTANLMDIDPNDYYLSVKSLDSNILALAPRKTAEAPRVIAIGSGSGQLLRISLELADSCMKQNSALPLADASVHVTVEVESKKGGASVTSSSAPAVDMGDLGDMALGDDYGRNPAVSSARRIPTDFHKTLQSRLTPLEIGMYVLLAVFCAAIFIFMASCFVYASKFNRQEYPLQRKSQSVQNAHDWVWLGKSTAERGCGSHNTSFDSNQSGSQRMSYVGSEINIVPNPNTDEYEAEVNRDRRRSKV